LKRWDIADRKPPKRFDDNCTSVEKSVNFQDEIIRNVSDKENISDGIDPRTSYADVVKGKISKSNCS
jgi:hypothetical protein